MSCSFNNFHGLEWNSDQKDFLLCEELLNFMGNEVGDGFVLVKGEERKNGSPKF